MPDLALWLLTAIGWTLGVVGIVLTLCFGLRSRRLQSKLDDTEEKLSSLLMVFADERAGKVIDLGDGRTREVVMLRSGRLGYNYTIHPEPAVVRFTIHPAKWTLSQSPGKREQTDDTHDESAG